jgi:hypothetical protein
MREKFKAYIDEKGIFSGIVCKYGAIHENNKPTLLLMDIMDLGSSQTHCQIKGYFFLFPLTKTLYYFPKKSTLNFLPKF